jgi:hypothetical protein
VKVKVGLSYQQRSRSQLAFPISKGHGHIWPVSSAKVLVTAGLSYQQRPQSQWLFITAKVIVTDGLSYQQLSRSQLATLIKQQWSRTRLASFISKGYGSSWHLLLMIAVGQFSKQRERLQWGFLDSKSHGLLTWGVRVEPIPTTGNNE